MKAKTATETESFDAAELGAMMREMRENLGHDLEFVARDLRIRLVYLEAIEEGRLKDLPGNAYISGFLRSYSDFLGLEGDEIVRRFKMAGAEISSQPQLHLPSPVEEGRLPTGSILLFAAVIAAAAYGGWYYLSAAGKGPIETVASLPKELSGLVNEAKNQTDAKAVSPSSSSNPSTSVPSTSVPSTTGPVSSVASASDTPSAAVPSSTGPSPSAMPSETAAATAEPAASPPAESQTAPDTAETPTAPETASAAPDSSAASQETAEAVPDTPAPAQAGSQTDSAASAAPAVTTSVVPAPASSPVIRQPDAPETDTGNTTASAPAVSPTRPASPAPDVTPRAAEPSTPAVATTSPAAAPAPAPSVPAQPETETVSQTANAAPSPEPVSTAPASSSAAGGVRIVVRATADSYVAVRTGDNEPLFSQLMRPGDSYEVPSGADLVLETGNAGGLQITIGGKRAPSLGPVGQIRRNIPLDAEKLLRGLN